ncbi:hypothetical protein AXI64_gp062 [Vibrio phage qdvp001]|uniref:hypothetical protein n=1 Tax=Vibrio phage qdvp001 TaxID=1003177 RepID=UPI000722448E|nr:hypothetical protein AXI64_gp062 [Vibrio phage qdvp001]ALM62054.1 hypothetical protein qdvp001_062 [Vibrio phage qdvp001]
MKFKFKEGQWFDVRKLTDWQKQWCLENLDWVSSCSKSQVESGLYSLVLYSTFGATIKRFGTTSKTYNQPENEITFNDFYWGEDDTEFLQESIFDKPRWVTCCNDSLGQVTLGKDYKVVNVNNDNYTIIMDKGIEGSLHKDRFHKVTPQDLLPKEVEDSFDNLVYIKPENDSTILYKNLSGQQLGFLLNSLTFNTRYGHNESDATHLSYDSGEGVWFTEVANHNPKDIIISFNDIFKEVD